MPLLPLPVLAVSRSVVCLRFPVLQPSPVPCQRAVRGAKSSSHEEIIPPLIGYRIGNEARHSPFPPVDCSSASSLRLLQMTDAAILWETAGLSCCGRRSMERLSENGLKQSRANKETGLCQQSCKLIQYAVQIHAQNGDKTLTITKQ